MVLSASPVVLPTYLCSTHDIQPQNIPQKRASDQPNCLYVQQEDFFLSVFLCFNTTNSYHCMNANHPLERHELKKKLYNEHINGGMKV